MVRPNALVTTVRLDPNIRSHRTADTALIKLKIVNAPLGLINT